MASTANANALMAAPLWWRFISTIRAAVIKEVLFRGYALERIEELSGSRIVAVVVSCAVFTLTHVSRWGWSHELIVAVGGLASLLYLWRRNLWANIIAHFIADAMSVLARAPNEEDCRQPFQRSSRFRVIAEKARDNL